MVFRLTFTISGWVKVSCIVPKLVSAVMFTLASRLGTRLENTQPLRVTLGQKNNQISVMKYGDLYLMVLLKGRTTADEFFSEARAILERKLSNV